MSDFGAGGIKLNGLTPKQSIGTLRPSQNIQLKGLNLDQQVNDQQQTVNPNWNNDGSSVIPQNYGTVPANDDLPPIFGNDVPVTNPANPNAKSATVGDPKTNTKKDEGLAIGIGMAIGAVGGGIIGSFISPGAGTVRGLGLGAKLGIGIGVIVGGFIGNTFEK